MSVDAELEESANVVAEIMCIYADDVNNIVKTRSVLPTDDLEAWLSLLRNFVEEPFRLSMKAASCSAAVMQGILNISKDTNYDADADTMQAVLDGMDAIFSYEYFYRAELQTPLERQLIILNVSHLLYSYCHVATDVNRTTSVVGRPSYESFQTRLRVTAIVLPINSFEMQEVYVPYELSHLRIPTVETGPYCLVTYDKTAYASRVADLLAMNSFSVTSGPFLNGTENTSSWSDGHFVVDLSEMEVTGSTEAVSEFNITCPLMRSNNSSSFFVPCVNFTHYEVQCSEDVGMWNFNCPDEMWTNMSCSRIIGNVTAEYSETCDVEFSWNNSITCVCRKAMKVDYGDRFVAVEFRSVLSLYSWTSMRLGRRLRP